MDNFFFPHKLFTIPEGKSEFEFFSACRDQPNKSGGTVAIGEHLSFVFKSTVWIPKEQTKYRLLPGELIKVINSSGDTILEEKVLKFTTDGLEENSIII